jgi:hypothetical protein
VILSGCRAASASAPPPTPTPSATRAAQAWHFVTRPDLTPPVITPTTTGTSGSAAVQAGEGQEVFLGPKDPSTGVAMQGELIVDASGDPVWVEDSDVGTFSFREQQYQGEPVLTYWVGNSTSYGHGDIVILDNTYTQIAAVTTGGNLEAHQADMHESDITPQGTMLLTSYPEVQADLSSIGGPKNGWVLEGVAEEVDIATNKVLFEWNSLDHVPITDTYQPIGESDGTKAYVSWNGATQVASWRVLTGSDADDATQVATVARSGFETAIAVPNAGTYVEVQALDSSGKVLGGAVAK